MIYDFEAFESESKFDMLADRVQRYLGVDLMSLFISVMSVSLI